jgi:hypothetical protein
MNQCNIWQDTGHIGRYMVIYSDHMNDKRIDPILGIVI